MSDQPALSGESDEVTFLGEQDEIVHAAPAPAAQPAWMVLIVDDDPSVHSITRLVLADVEFQGRCVQTISAHSCAEALAILRTRLDIALILLDVVMESDDAGLRLVREVRDQLGNRAVRIILRTGEPGQAPERRVILDFDINDYKSKADLTAQSLFTATIAALRSYAEIVALEQNRHGLARLFSGSAWLFAQFEINAFANAALMLLGSLFDHPIKAALLLRGDEGWRILAGYGGLEAAGIESLPSDAVLAVAVAAPASTAQFEFRPVHCKHHAAAALLVLPSVAATSVQRDLLDMASTTIGVGLDNAALHQSLKQEQAALEHRVQQRTAELAQTNKALHSSRTLLEEDLRAAGVLQQAILPDGFPPHPRIQGAAMMRAARQIGGDFFDVVACDADRIVLLVGDVSGKGAQAALFMVLVRALVQEVMAGRSSQSDLDSAIIMAETNRRLLARNPLSLFVTMMFCVLDATTGDLHFCSAGQGMPLIRRADGTVERLSGRPSPMLGLIEAAHFSAHLCKLAVGDAVILNTDGFEEAQGQDGSWFGAERLRQSLAATSVKASAADMLGAVTRAVEDFCGTAPLADDLTCVVARWMP